MTVERVYRIVPHLASKLIASVHTDDESPPTGVLPFVQFPANLVERLNGPGVEGVRDTFGLAPAKPVRC
jgi:hypothetical protein